MVNAIALRTLRAQSGTCGSRTYGSILSSSCGGAGSGRRMYGWYKKNATKQDFYNVMFGVPIGNSK